MEKEKKDHKGMDTVKHGRYKGEKLHYGKESLTEERDESIQQGKRWEEG